MADGGIKIKVAVDKARNRVVTIVRSEPSLQGHGSDCRCGQVMARVAHVFSRKEGAGKFVSGNLRFVISDDL